MSFLIPKKPQILYAPMLSSFGGGSARGFNPGGADSGLYEFTSFTFTSAGQTGRDGPSLSEMQTAYSSTSWTQDTEYLNSSLTGVQLWTVPVDAAYDFALQGGSSPSPTSGSSTSGKGRIVNFRVSLVKGTKINILVGQSGLPANGDYEMGAGGMTAVFDEVANFGAIGVANLFAVAAAGAGGSEANNGSTTERDGIYSFGGAVGNSSGGTGGPAGVGGSYGGSGGGGYSSNGGGRYNNDGDIYGGASLKNGALGGNGQSGNGNGGFGGGGSARGSNYAGGGGGGGYTGGRAGDNGNNISGGGGSYVGTARVTSYSDGGLGSIGDSGTVTVTKV